MVPIRDKNEFVAALSEARAFLFLWVNWAIHARKARGVVEQTVAAWQSEHPDQPIPCYMLDVSDQSGEVWDALAEWLMAEGRPAERLMMSGVGPLLWLRSGHVVLHVLAPPEYGATKLAAASRGVFEPDAEPSTTTEGGGM